MIFLEVEDFPRTHNPECTRCEQTESTQFPSTLVNESYHDVDGLRENSATMQRWVIKWCSKLFLYLFYIWFARKTEAPRNTSEFSL